MRVVVIGGGVAGLSLATHVLEGARRRGADLSLLVLEAAPRAGGHAWTIREDGFLIEGGPNGFLDRERDPEPRELVRLLGLESRVIEANPVARRRFVLRRGRLRRVPDGPLTLLTSAILSPRGRMRVLMEPWARKPPDGDESVFEFAARRIGREAAEVLVDAAVSGISAGDSRRLSVASAFPIMKEMEREHGSLVRAMMARRGMRPARLLSFDGGLRVLIDAMQERCGSSLRTTALVREIRREGTGWRASLEDGTSVPADHVALALPAHQAARIVSNLDPQLAATLEAFPFSGVAMVALAYRADDTGPLRGYGYLVPSFENLATLGVLWESSVFDGRAPENHVLLRVMMGGARRAEIASLEPEELERHAVTELNRVMRISTTPLRSWVRRWPQAIAQYDFGHEERVRTARSLCAAHPGLEICGTSYDGISFGMAIASAAAAAKRILGAVGAGTSGVGVA